MTSSPLKKLFENAEELVVPEESTVEGEIPDWLNGSFIRVGPGKWDLEHVTMNHFLDGYAILSKFEIHGKTVTFQQKYLQSDAYLKGTAAGKPLVTEFGTKAHSENKGIFSRIRKSLTPPEVTDNTACSLFQLPNKDLFATSNTTFFHQINPHDLGTGEKYDYSQCFGVNGVSVHPLKDQRGDLYQIGFSVTGRPKYHVIKIRGDEKYGTTEDLMKHSSTLVSIPSRWNLGVGYFHSFGLTSNFIVFVEIPYVISITKAAKAMLTGDPLKDWLEWRPNDGTKFFVVNKHTGKVLKVEYVAKAFFFLHVVNAFERDDLIVIDINAYDCPAVIDSLDLTNLRCSFGVNLKDPPVVTRFVIPLTYDLASVPSGVNLIGSSYGDATAVKTGHQIRLCPEILSPPGLEMLTINPCFQGKPYSCLYASGTICQNQFTNSICKVNLTSQEVVIWKGSLEDYPGEPLFIPEMDHYSGCSTGDEDEDSGVLISAVSSASERRMEEDKTDYLVFINPKTMEELGRAAFKARIPQAMHGIFLRD